MEYHDRTLEEGAGRSTSTGNIMQSSEPDDKLITVRDLRIIDRDRAPTRNIARIFDGTG